MFILINILSGGYMEDYTQELLNKLDDEVYDNDDDDDPIIENKDGVEYGNVFCSWYYGYNIFFYVLDVKEDKVLVCELQTYKGVTEDGRKYDYFNLDRWAYATTRPAIFLPGEKRRVWVKTSKKKNKKIIYYPIRYGCPIYNRVKKKGVEFPKTGIFFAMEAPDNVFDTKWEIEGVPEEFITKKKKEKKINKNSA